jgi:hypothetical protein
MSRSARLAIVAHDAGGAQILSSYLRRQGREYRDACVFALAGPARGIFESKLGPLASTNPEAAVTASASLLCGTGWQTDWELRAIGAARQARKRSAAFLDHWVNYRERFTRGGQLQLPDEVWVGDEIALELARTQLPEVPARLLENPYFLDVREQLEALPRRAARSGGQRVLYLCEPVREHALKQYGDERHWGYTEEDALRYFLDHLQVLGKSVASIVVRPHPSEAAEKYEPLLRDVGLPVRFSTETDLLADIADSDIVVGCNSMAMVIGLLAGRRVVCCIPPGGRPCVLPHDRIEQLTRLVACPPTPGKAP